MKRIWPRRSGWIRNGWVMAVMSLAITGCTDPIFFLNSRNLPFNFHELDAGKAYRSSQPTGEELQTIIDLVGVRTVINLRGTNADERWYQDEVRVCKDNGVVLVDHRMSSGSLPEPALLRAIVETLQTAETPILIHCQGGSDRTGLVSVIYRRLIAGDGQSEALKQLSTRYFHFRASAPCMDYLAERYEPTETWLDQYTQNFEQYECGN